ncbi:gene transfer agent family protein [Agrobacterium sp. Ap1]|uniref:gene transfer agent family protein n=1 Tax=Agrobacterium sp. Ap1 TaxID=2815337 RepID=UPI001A8CC7A8|nr:gene transfer agent family protein [Agrobacterium sp. Ap1]MBO0140218.1 gene transfer agent family protein [Agrobacterium sp. Ap1]
MNTTKNHASITEFFGDAEYPLCLTFALAAEWEKLRERSLNFTFACMVETRAAQLLDVREVVRLGLIGGGMEPREAHEKVRVYVENRPLVEGMAVALSVMEAFLFGSDEWREANPARDVAA